MMLNTGRIAVMLAAPSTISSENLPRTALRQPARSRSAMLRTRAASATAAASSFSGFPCAAALPPARGEGLADAGDATMDADSASSEPPVSASDRSRAEAWSSPSSSRALGVGGSSPATVRFTALMSPSGSSPWTTEEPDDEQQLSHQKVPRVRHCSLQPAAITARMEAKMLPLGRSRRYLRQGSTNTTSESVRTIVAAPKAASKPP
mmetsp:Transcript_17575/g.66430  ORF Transcript_17575/g.66430 Transcript_17575/m.66430 type:complete len:207 (-) Transcript_17575:625-1245(-)